MTDEYDRNELWGFNNEKQKCNCHLLVVKVFVIVGEHRVVFI